MSPSLLLLALLQAVFADKEPSSQDDLYIWKAPYPPRNLARFQNVKGYRFTHQTVSKQLQDRVQKQKEKDFGDQCTDNPPQDWPIYKYDLGIDGQLLVVSCISSSMNSWSVYYHHTQDDQLRPITVQFPILSADNNTLPSSQPKIIGFQERQLLENSEILQRRLVSKHQELKGQYRQYRAEWIWKEGYGLELIEYSTVIYDEHSQPKVHILYQEGMN